MNALNVVLILFPKRVLKILIPHSYKTTRGKGVLNVNLKTEHQNNVF